MDEITNPFDTYRVHFATTNPHGYDYTRIDFYYGGEKVGQILSGKAITPGSYASELNGGEIHLYFDAAMLANTFTILQRESNLALYLEFDQAGQEQQQAREGGIRHRN